MASREGIILVAPNAVNPAVWEAGIDGPGLLVAILEAVGRKHGFDSKRRYLFGHSAGANFSLLLAARQPGFFDAIAAHAGALNASGEEWIAKATLAPKTPIQPVARGEPNSPPGLAPDRGKSSFLDAPI